MKDDKVYRIIEGVAIVGGLYAFGHMIGTVINMIRSK